jgi:hypothetical protein
MMVVDAATGNVVADMPIENAIRAIGGPDAAWAWMGTWEADGIRFTGSCYACDALIQGEYALWQPDTGGFIPKAGVYFSVFGRNLNATNEFLLLTQNQAFAYSVEEGMFPTPNVVHYTRPGQIVDFTSGQTMPQAAVAYFDMGDVSLSRVEWVADGHGFIVIPRNKDYWDVITRVGANVRLDRSLEDETIFLAGTPAGWVESVTDSSGNPTIYHRSLDGTRDHIMIMADDIVLQVIDVPDLGHSLANPPPAFPLVTTPSPEQRSTQQSETATTCPGFLRSRLVIGEMARVTPGDPNRVRQQPTTDSAIVGQIPGSGEFRVMGGPVCDSVNGIAWWQVDYDGLVGWTAEGQGNSYWTEPLSR